MVGYLEIALLLLRKAIVERETKDALESQTLVKFPVAGSPSGPRTIRFALAGRELEKRSASRDDALSRSPLPVRSPGRRMYILRLAAPRARTAPYLCR